MRKAFYQSKKGVTQVDWAISLAIFLLFLIWFFFFTKPVYDGISNYESLANIVEEELLKEVQVSMTERPIIIYSNTSRTNEPFIIDYRLSDNNSLHRMADNSSFIITDNQLIFIKSVPNATDFVNLLYSEDENINFDSFRQVSDLKTTDTYTSVTNFIAYFDNYSIDQLWYAGERKLFKFSQQINDLQFANDSGEYQNNSLFGRYVYSNTAINQSHYVFAYNSGVYSTLDLLQVIPGQGKTVRLDFTMRNYTSYYVDPINTGPIDYVFSSCEEFTNIRLIDLYNEDNGVVFTTEDPANITLCGKEPRSNISITFALTNQSSYRIQFHEGDYNNGTVYSDYPDVEFGYGNELEGIYLDLFDNLTDTSYRQVKDRWNYPGSRDFQIEVWNSTSQLFVYEPVPIPAQTNVYTKEIFAETLNQERTVEVVRIFIRVW